MARAARRGRSRRRGPSTRPSRPRARRRRARRSAATSRARVVTGKARGHLRHQRPGAAGRVRRRPRGPTATPPTTTWTAPRTAPSRRRRPTTTPPSGRATSAPCTTSRCSSATRTRSTAPVPRSDKSTGRPTRPARTGCRTSTRLRGTSDDTMRNYYLEQSHGAYTVQGDIEDWVTLDLPESWYGADSDPWNSTDDLTGPVWRVARDAIVKFAADNPDFDWAQYDQENPWGITGVGLLPARRLPRPPDPHPRRQRPVGRRRRPGSRLHLGALLGHLRELQRRPRRRPRHDDPGHRRPGPAGPRHLGLQLHDQPRGRRRRRVLPRVRPRPRPARRVRLLQRHRRRHQRLLDHHGQRLLARPRVGPRHPAGGDERRGTSTPSASSSPRSSSAARTATVKLQAAADGDADATGVKIQLPKAKHTIELSGKDGATEWYSTMGNDIDVTLDDQGRRSPCRPEHRPHATAPGTTSRRATTTASSRSPTTAAPRGTRVRRVHRHRHRPLGRHADRRPLRLRGQGRPRPLRVLHRRRRGPQGLGGHRRHRRRTSPCRESAFATDGWIRVDGEWKQKTERYYIAEYRTYDGFDASLKNCYQWNYIYASWVDWFSYNKGLHLIYRDTFYIDNDVARTSATAAGWSSTPTPRPTASTTPTAGRLRGLLAAAHPGARRVLQPQADQDAEHLLRRLRRRAGASARDVAPGKAAQPTFNDTKDLLVRRGPRGRGQDPQEPGRAHQRQDHEPDTMTIWVDNVK